eukprot:Nitzschia sp. Nitz4//scaffold51_size120721//34259//39017//NITZ4_003720-RA/size120721-snap-gene-0.33-mRNA-1//-1//CDS//3329553841//5885//frame0
MTEPRPRGRLLDRPILRPLMIDSSYDSDERETGLLSPRSTGRRKRRLKESLLRKNEGNRLNHMRVLVSQRRQSQQYLAKLMRRDSLVGSTHGVLRTPRMDDGQDGSTEMFTPPPIPGRPEPISVRDVSRVSSADYELTDVQKEQMKQMSATLKSIKRMLVDFEAGDYLCPVEVRVEELSYVAQVAPAASKIKTVYNSSIIYDVVKFFKGFKKGHQAPQMVNKVILDRISLTLHPGRAYLVLGPPSSGKTSFLKAIAGRLATNNGEQTTGNVTYNGKSLDESSGFHLENLISMIDQLDRHAPRLTVDETFEFAFQCKKGGRHMEPSQFTEEGWQEMGIRLEQRANRERLMVNMNLTSLGLSHVRDTFVGDTTIRGVSGGQRRRVTVGEMMVGSPPVLLADEISNGLDASSTFDMIQCLIQLSKDYLRTRVVSLLQPSPETVALFDEIILLAEGRILYAGPVSRVEDYFAELGYEAPPYVDVADFLQLLSNPADCDALFNPPPEIAEVQKEPYTTKQLADLFRESVYGQRIKDSLDLPHHYVWSSSHKGVQVADEATMLDDGRYKRKFANSVFRSTYLNLKRNLMLWMRDRRVLIANAAKNIIMGISVGGVFYQTEDAQSIFGVLFQGMMFIMLGAMTVAPGFIDERPVYYKQADANFFSAYPFVIGKAMSKLPQTMMDCFAFGTILYFMVGFANTAENYFIFMATIVCFSVAMNELLFVLATFARTKDGVQVGSACLVFFFILFSGFIISPDVIPRYYTWIYHYNPMAWAYRSLLINEYRSSDYTDEEGDYVLKFAGFLDANGNPYKKEWVGYTFYYLIGHTVFTMLASALILQFVRVRNLPAVSDDVVSTLSHADGQGEAPAPELSIPFKPVAVTFEKICYDVKTSKGGDTLRLLHNVNGAFRSGRMCALMGSSGAGKTTLMDVIALRKTTGIVTGEVRLNGYKQDPVVFRRCSGYVEQFDVQSAELTVRETVLFSARLRLDATKVPNDDDKKRFVDEVLKTLELTPLADVLVGTNDGGGLSFEQKKRLSIAIELAASPSVLFLDEPTTGLDARSAMLVVRQLRKIADQGRTICATIHQPSSAVFDMFDDLLLLKKGGKVVFFGETGEQSKELIRYFEAHGAQPIDTGDNPANWMLREMQSEDKDLAEEYLKTPEYKMLQMQLEDVRTRQVEALELTYPTTFAVPAEHRQRFMNKRLQTIYWRSPAYNLSRLLVCCIIAFILGSVFLTDRRPAVTTEASMRSRLAVTFLSFIIIGILSIISVLPVMLSIRDVFYRHRAAGMLDNVALGWAIGTAEKWFIVLASFMFCLVYVSVSGIATGLLNRSIRFWGIFTFNLAIYSYTGQAFMCLVPSMPTAQILASVFIGINNFFSGLIVRPQFMTGLFEYTYWITPGHYVYEALVMAEYADDERIVMAVDNSEFYDYLGCGEYNIPNCNGTVEQYVDVFFGGRFNKNHQRQNITVLAFILVAARVLTFYALGKFHFSNT